MLRQLAKGPVLLFEAGVRRRLHRRMRLRQWPVKGSRSNALVAQEQMGKVLTWDPLGMS